MKKILLTLLTGIFLFPFIASAQFTPTSCEGQAHCAAPTPGIHYKDTIIYIGAQGDEFDLGFQQNFDKQKVLLEEIFITENKNFSEEEIMEKIMENLKEIQDTKILIINTSKFDVLLQLLAKVHASENLNLGEKTIYLVTNSNKYFLKRILANHIKPLEITTIYTLSQSKLLNFLSTLSLGKITNEEEYITPFSISFKETPKYLAISYLVDRLIYHGFPIELITFFLTLSLGVLIVSILRQVVGFSVFGIYSPLLFAVSLSVFGLPLSMTLLIMGLFTKILVKFFTKKIYLLHNAKTSLLVMLYFFLLLLVLGVMIILKINIFDLTIFSNTFIILPILFVIIISDKVFNDGFRLFSKGRWIAFFEFLIVSFAVYGLFYWTGLKHFLLAFPELLILIFFLNIAVGRFTGLQLLEYFRFMPLIKSSSETEEEEE